MVGTEKEAHQLQTVTVDSATTMLLLVRGDLVVLVALAAKAAMLLNTSSPLIRMMRLQSEGSSTRVKNITINRTKIMNRRDTLRETDHLPQAMDRVIRPATTMILMTRLPSRPLLIHPALMDQAAKPVTMTTTTRTARLLIPLPCRDTGQAVRHVSMTTRMARLPSLLILMQVGTSPLVDSA